MKRSLKFKIVAPISVGFLVLIVGLTVWAITVSGRAIGEMDRSKGLTLSKVSAEGIWNSLLFQDIDGLSSSMKNLQKDPAMIAAAVFGKEGKALAGVGRFEEVQPFESDRVIEEVHVKEAALGETDCVLYSTPVINADNKEVLGSLVLAVSREASTDAVGAIRLAILIGGLIAVVLVGFGAYLLVGRLLRPLHSANQLMSQLSEGRGIFGSASR